MIRFIHRITKKLLLSSSGLSSVHLSAWNTSAPTGRICMKFGIWVFFGKSVQKRQVSLESDEKNGYFTWRSIYSFSVSGSVFLGCKIFHTEVVEKIKTHVVCSVRFFFGYLTAYEIICKSILLPDGSQMTIWHCACALLAGYLKATNTHLDYVILIAFSQRQWLHERASMLRYSTLPVIFCYLLPFHTYILPYVYE